jgi:hypothetical protein
MFDRNGAVHRLFIIILTLARIFTEVTRVP